MGLSQNEVITLASIVDEETNDESEMPKVAGSTQTPPPAARRFRPRRIFFHSSGDS